MLFQDMDVKGGRVVSKDIGKHNDRPDSDFDADELALGIKIEKEHTDNEEEAKDIAKDHLKEIPDYYSRLKKMEEGAKTKDASLVRAISYKGYIIEEYEDFFAIKQYGSYMNTSNGTAFTKGDKIDRDRALKVAQQDIDEWEKHTKRW
jgi:hypothetical protein